MLVSLIRYKTHGLVICLWLTVQKKVADKGLYFLFLVVFFSYLYIFYVVEYNLFVCDCQSKEREMKKVKKKK